MASETFLDWMADDCASCTGSALEDDIVSPRKIKGKQPVAEEPEDSKRAPALKRPSTKRVLVAAEVAGDEQLEGTKRPSTKRVHFAAEVAGDEELEGTPKKMKRGPAKAKPGPKPKGKSKAKAKAKRKATPEATEPERPAPAPSSKSKVVADNEASSCSNAAKDAVLVADAEVAEASLSPQQRRALWMQYPAVAISSVRVRLVAISSVLYWAGRVWSLL